jgi:hypothetical protein
MVSSLIVPEDTFRILTLKVDKVKLDKLIVEKLPILDCIVFTADNEPAHDILLSVEKLLVSINPEFCSVRVSTISFLLMISVALLDFVKNLKSPLAFVKSVNAPLRLMVAASAELLALLIFKLKVRMVPLTFKEVVPNVEKLMFEKLALVLLIVEPLIVVKDIFEVLIDGVINNGTLTG